MVLKNYKIVLLSAIFLITGCTTATISDQQDNKDQSSLSPSWFDPLSLDDDDILLNGQAMPDFSNTNDSSPQFFDEADYNLMTEGYRVQIFTTQNLMIADSILTLADSLFMGEQYLLFDAPNYKIRVGNCKTRAEAEALQIFARQSGFRNSWVLKTEVFAISRKREVMPKLTDEELLLEQ